MLNFKSDKLWEICFVSYCKENICLVCYCCLLQVNTKKNSKSTAKWITEEQQNLVGRQQKIMWIMLFTVSGYGLQSVTYWKLPYFCFSFSPSSTPVLLSVIKELVCLLPVRIFNHLMFTGVITCICFCVVVGVVNWATGELQFCFNKALFFL